MAIERRRSPGTFGYLWCRQCHARFVVAGRRQQRAEGPAIELIVCPYCRAMRRMVLPRTVGIPVRILGRDDRLRDE
jgi:hypothetical protein